jgi:hypothetical protein
MRLGRIGGGRSAAWRAIALAALACAAACSPPADEVRIDRERVASRPSSPVIAGVTSAQRFEFSTEQAPARDPAERPARGFDFMTPPGWVELASSGARPINLRPAGNPDAECYVAVLSGAGGGLASNVDRWRKQMGLEPAAPGAAEALPEIEVFGTPAKLLELSGSFAGMGSEPRPGWKLIGALQERGNAALFVKMTGPAAVVDSEREAFLAFCASLRAVEDGAAQASAKTEPDRAPPPDAGAVGGSQGGPFRWQAPSDWKETAPRPMRLVSFQMGRSSECYVSVLGGEGGGLVANLDRWKGELGLGRTTPAEVASLQRVPMLGHEAVLFEGVGEYSSMGGDPRPDSAMLGAICMRDQDSVFVKMIGPRDEVLALREPFVRFLASFEEAQ